MVRFTQRQLTFLTGPTLVTQGWTRPVGFVRLPDDSARCFMLPALLQSIGEACHSMAGHGSMATPFQLQNHRLRVARFTRLWGNAQEFLLGHRRQRKVNQPTFFSLSLNELNCLFYFFLNQCSELLRLGRLGWWVWMPEQKNWWRTQRRSDVGCMSRQSQRRTWLYR